MHVRGVVTIERMFWGSWSNKKRLSSSMQCRDDFQTNSGITSLGMHPQSSSSNHRVPSCEESTSHEHGKDTSGTRLGVQLNGSTALGRGSRGRGGRSTTSDVQIEGSVWAVERKVKGKGHVRGGRLASRGAAGTGRSGGRTGGGRASRGRGGGVGSRSSRGGSSGDGGRHRASGADRGAATYANTAGVAASNDSGGTYYASDY